MPRIAKNTVTANAEAITALIKRETAKRGATARQQEWKVLGVPGLSLALKPSGVAIYYMRFMAGHGARRRQVRKAIGQANGATAIKLADAKAAALRVARDGPQDYANDGEPGITLTALFEKFEAFERSAKHDRRRTESTMSAYRAAFEKDVFGELGSVPVAEITAKDLAQLLAKVEARSRHSAHKVRAVFGSLYRWAVKRMLVESNITIGMGYSFQGKPRGRRLSDEEVAKMWAAVDSHEFDATPGMRLVLKLAMLTGQRNSEVAGARRSELHIGDSIATPFWQIHRSRMKRKDRDQWVFLSSQARQLFGQAVALAGDSAYVFPAAYQGRHAGREHLMQESVSLAWKRAARIAGVRDAHLHDMRATITSWLGDRGERSDVLDRILHHHPGHHTGQRSSVTDSHYNFGVMSGPLRDAWARWGDHLWAITGQGESGSTVVELKRA